MTPHLKVKFADDEFDRASPKDLSSARIGGLTLPLEPFELQIGYKLPLGAQKDLEYAARLYTVFEQSVSVARLEKWVTRLGVDDECERLKRA